ncbi:MAG: OmpA family protein [Burkholderiaceae bacterium]|nr:OmpA family protein [Burkholderiaceae bacterium]
MVFTTIKSHWSGWLIACVFTMLGGCAAPAAKQSIVLVPDPAGHVGMAEVRTAAGAQVLRNAGDITQTRGAAAAPSAVSTAAAPTISNIFGEALAAEPPPAQTFTLLFENNSSVLRADSLAQLDEIAEISQRSGLIRVSISGHTDAIGSDRLNDNLARTRAEEVRQQLLRRRVSASLLTVSSHGKGNPLVVTPDGVAEPRNRRVVVIIR